MNRLTRATLIAIMTFAGIAATAQDMRWTTKVTETVQQGGRGGGGRGGGGRGGGGQQNEVTREKTVTVLMKMSKVSLGDGKDVVSFKHTPLKDQAEADAAHATIPWDDKDKLLEALKTTLAEMKRPGTAEERKQVYANGDSTFAIKSVREGNTKNVVVTMKYESGKEAAKSTDFTLPLQEVEVFFNRLRNMK